MVSTSPKAGMPQVERLAVIGSRSPPRRVGRVLVAHVDLHAHPQIAIRERCREIDDPLVRELGRGTGGSVSTTPVGADERVPVEVIEAS